MTKKEKENLKKQEGEKKAREEEETRKRAEKEEHERKEQEKKENEERLLREAEESKLRKIQLTELDSIFDFYETQLFQEKALSRSSAKWARYMKCDGSPDPTDLPSINMFMSLWREDKHNNDFIVTLKECELVLQLIDELSWIIEDSVFDPEVTDYMRNQYRSTAIELEQLLQEKLDLGTHGVMSLGSSLAKPETGNLEYTSEVPLISLSLWGNLSKNPRIKTHEFVSVGIFFELPKILILTDCAIRILITKFDHLSQHSSSFHPRIKQKEPVDPSPSAEAAAAEEVADHENKVAGGEDEEDEMLAKTATEISDKEDEDQDVMEILKKIQSGVDLDKTDDSEKTATPVVEQEPQPPPEPDYVILTPEPVDYEDFEGEDDVVDLRAFQVVGGVIHFNLLQMPPQPKVVKNWTITQLIEPPELKCINYFSDVPKPVEETVVSGVKPLLKKNSSAQMETTKSEGRLSARNSKSDLGIEATESGVDISETEVEEVKPKPRVGIEGPPIFITIRLPEDVYFCEEPQVVRWDEESKNWRTNGFIDKIYAEATRLMTFRTHDFGTLAFIQDSHVNMPFQSWELRPRGVNHAQLTIIAAVVEVELQIKDGLVCLSQPENKAELAHLINKWMSVSDLIQKLKQSGVNLFPAEDSFKYVRIPDKNPITEARLYHQMALVASACAFSWSKWNAEVNNRDRIVVQAMEHLLDEPLAEDELWLCMVTKKRCARLKMAEYDEVFTDDLQSAEFFADVYHLTHSLISEEAKDRVRKTSKNFLDAVHRLLSAVRLAAYS